MPIRTNTVALTLTAAFSLSTFAQELPTNGSIETRVGKLTFESGYPS